jgi:hypothetical protein
MRRNSRATEVVIKFVSNATNCDPQGISWRTRQKACKNEPDSGHEADAGLGCLMCRARRRRYFDSRNPWKGRENVKFVWLRTAFTKFVVVLICMQLNPVELEKQLLLESTRTTSHCFVDQKLMYHWFYIPVRGNQIYFPGNGSETNSSYSAHG